MCLWFRSYDMSKIGQDKHSENFISSLRCSGVGRAYSLMQMPVELRWLGFMSVVHSGGVFI